MLMRHLVSYFKTLLWKEYIDGFDALRALIPAQTEEHSIG